MVGEAWGTLEEPTIPVTSVLVVEDEPASADYFKAILEERQIRVRIAKDGGQAQSTFQMYRPDFIVMDLMLPGESGYEICERFKAKDDTIPILVVSAIDLPESRDLAIRAGADGYLTKPVAPQELIGAMYRVAQVVWERVHLGNTDPGVSDEVRFQCGCGKKLKMSGSHRGRSFRCPSCGESMIVPRR